MVLVGHVAPLWDLCLVMSEYTAPGCEDQCEAGMSNNGNLRGIFSDSNNMVVLLTVMTLTMVLEQQSDRPWSPVFVGKRRNAGFVTKSLFPLIYEIVKEAG